MKKQYNFMCWHGAYEEHEIDYVVTQRTDPLGDDVFAFDSLL